MDEIPKPPGEVVVLESCPSLDQWSLLLEDVLPAEDKIHLECHLEVCPRCQEGLEGLTAFAHDAWIGPHRLPFSKSARKDPPPEIPGYELGAILGRGGHGVVYQGRELALDRPVAIKILRSGVLAEPEERQRLLREARAAARLNHPHIVRIHTVGEHGGLPYLVMELLTGGTVAQRLKGQSLPPDQAVPLVATLARTVAFAHHQGIVHRDLKPSNILLADGTLTALRLVDFGLAKIQNLESRQTPSGTIAGTPAYMAPEQVVGTTHGIGLSVDIHALGVILYELLTGTPPFLAATPFETLVQVRDCKPPSLRRRCPDLPNDLETICLRCLAKDPKDRYPSADALADDLERVLAGAALDTVVAKPQSRGGRSLATIGLRVLLVGLAAVGAVGVWRAAFPPRKMQSLFVAEVTSLLETLETSSGGSEAQRESARRLLQHLDTDPTLPEIVEARIGELLDPIPWETHLKRAKTAARLAAAFVEAGDTRLARPLLSSHPTPTARSFFVSALAEAHRGKKERLLELACQADTAPARRVLVLALGVEPFPGIDDGEQAEVLQSVLRFYRDDPDPGVHGAAEWVLRRWEQLDRIRAAREDLLSRQPSPGQPLEGRAWSIGPQRHTMLHLGQLFPEGTGSGRGFLPTFSLAAHEVSVLQHYDFLRAHPKPIQIREVSGQRGRPAFPIPLFMARSYCNWLSHCAGLGDEECYESPTLGTFVLRADWRQRRGFRLPTVDEWEQACMAGAQSRFPHGEADELHEHYIHSSEVAVGQTSQNVGRRRPNEYGLFDMLGNAAEWCEVPDEGRAVLCGGSARIPPVPFPELRADPERSRDAIFAAGFRVARGGP